MDNHAVTHLYKKVVSPSIKFKTEEWRKQHHPRHSHYYGLSPTVRRRLVVGPSRSTYSAPGRVENKLAIQQKPPNDGVEDLQHGNYYFQPSITFKTTSLPAMPLNKKYTPSMAVTVRSVPVSPSRHSAVTLPDRLANENPRLLFTSQRQRWEVEEKARMQSRRLKRTSEIVAHRMDKQYYMAGSGISMGGRWQVDTNDLLKLKLLAHHQQLADYNKVKNSETNLLDVRESPGGQMSSPTPGERDRRRESGVTSVGLESRSGTEGAWAETGSDASSVDEFDSISMRGHQAHRRDKKMKEENAEKKDSAQQNSDENKVTETDEKDNEDEKENDLKEMDNNENNDKTNGDISEEKDKQNEKTKLADKNEKSELSENETGQKTDENEMRTSENETKDGEMGTKNIEKETKNSESNSEKKSSPVKSPKKGRIRFKDEVKTKKGANGDKGKDEKKKEDENKEGEEKHENKYMNEWLGIKKKPEIDPRYKPGKPPPNRIFISSDPATAKKEAGKFSEIFLTEISTIQQDEADSGETLSAESKFGIINAKQRLAFKSMFDEVDKDKSGSVSLEELKLRMRPTVSRGDIKHFVQVFDLNKDKTIDGREFAAISALNDRLAGSRTETADGCIALNLEKLAQHIVIFKEMFKIMDEDDDNRLDANEVLIMVSAAMTTEVGSDLELARSVLEGARDEFGYIDFVGFLSYIPFFAKLLKIIMSSPLTIAQIEQARDRVKEKELTFKPKKPQKQEPKSWEAF